MSDEPQEKIKCFGVGFGIWFVFWFVVVFFFTIIKLLAVVSMAIIKICPGRGHKNPQT